MQSRHLRPDFFKVNWRSAACEGEWEGVNPWRYGTNVDLLSVCQYSPLFRLDCWETRCSAFFPGHRAGWCGVGTCNACRGRAIGNSIIVLHLHSHNQSTHCTALHLIVLNQSVVPPVDLHRSAVLISWIFNYSGESGEAACYSNINFKILHRETAQGKLALTSTSQPLPYMHSKSRSNCNAVPSLLQAVWQLLQTSLAASH